MPGQGDGRGGGRWELPSVRQRLARLWADLTTSGLQQRGMDRGSGAGCVGQQLSTREASRGQWGCGGQRGGVGHFTGVRRGEQGSDSDACGWAATPVPGADAAASDASVTAYAA